MEFSKVQHSNNMNYNKIHNKKENVATKSAHDKIDDKTTLEGKQEDTSVVYEKSTTASPISKTTIDQLKAEAEKRTASLKNLVREMFTKQGISFDESNFYSKLREGNYEVDEETRLQAQKDVAQDGYYGIEQTSERLVSFAKALSGNDASKADLMINSVLQGFEEATKAWGGELPEISKKTLDATVEKLNVWKNSLTHANKV